MKNTNQNQKIVNGVNVGHMFENAKAVKHNKDTSKIKSRQKENGSMEDMVLPLAMIFTGRSNT